MKRYETYKDSNILWLDKIPSHWREEKLKHISTCNDEVLPEDTPESELIHYVEISDVDSVSGIKNHTDYTFGDAPSRARRITRKNDVIISTVRTYLKAIATVKEDGLIVSTGFAVIRPTKVDQKFLAYSLLNDDFLGEVISKSVGVSYPAINSSDLIEIKLPMPPKEEQEAIASYLDIKVGQIDSAIAEKVKMLEDFKAYRSAIINEAVTKGLDKNVEMKDSGIQWWKEIPAHWDLRKAKHMFSLVTKNVLDSSLPKIALENIESWTGKYIETDSDFMGGGVEFKKDDILFGKLRPYLAKVYKADFAGQAIGDIYVFRGNEEQVSEYLKYLLLSYPFISVVDGSTYGAKMPRANWDFISHLVLPCPPQNEQQTIAAYLGHKVGLIDATYEETKQILEELKSYKSALITEAVTGKIDLREWKPKVENV